MNARSRWAYGVAGAIVAVGAATFAIGPAGRAYRERSLRRAVQRLAMSAAPPRSTRFSIAQPPPTGAAMRSGGVEPAFPSAFYQALTDVSEMAKQQDTPAALRAHAIASYYGGQFVDGSKDLERLVQFSASAADWSDLAAARLEIALATNTPLAIVPALVAADRALEIEPGLPAALFNRAAALETLGLRLHARLAWERCLLAESDSVWRERIRERLSAAASEPHDQAWKVALARLDADSDGAVREAVERFPQDARKAAETALPIDWAAATIAKDQPTAVAKLKLARALANAIRSRSGERMAAESIDAIDAAIASAQSSRVSALANAFSIYGDGRMLYQKHENAHAETKLRQATNAFADANSPMTMVARYYAANAVLDQNRPDEAAAEYATLTREANERRYGALGSHIAWQVARTEGIRGHWDAAFEAAARSVAGFRALGERENTGTMENMLAELYDYLGQPERAWEHRAAAFDLMSAAGARYRLQVALGGASRIFVRKQDWPAAIAFLDLEIATSRTVDDSALLADAMVRRARARFASGDPAAASRDIVAARAAASTLSDPNLSTKVSADIDAAQGVCERTRSASQSVRLLSNAIAFYQRAGSILLPELYLERGRSRLALGADEDALVDFGAGIDRLEAQRATVSELELYSTAVDVGEDLYVEAVRLAARRHDAASAFDFSERGRGRALMRHRIAGSPKRAISTETRPGVHLVEFMVLPEQVVAFTVDRELRMTVLELRRDDLERMVGHLNAAIIDRQPLAQVQAAGAALYDALLRPLGPGTRRASAIVFIPNKILERVPWAALYDRDARRYLAEDTNVVLLPSADMLEPRRRRALHLPRRRRSSSATRARRRTSSICLRCLLLRTKRRRSRAAIPRRCCCSAPRPREPAWCAR